MKVCHPSEKFTSLKTLILQLQLTLELSQILEILSTYSDLFILFAKYIFLLESDSSNSTENTPLVKSSSLNFDGCFITSDPARDGGNWWNYCNSNPLTFLDFNGLQSIYLPGGGTTFNGPCPGMKYNMETYSKECDAVGDFVDGISSNAKGLAVIIDKVFLNSKFEKKAEEFQVNVLLNFQFTSIEAKYSGVFDLDQNGNYDDKEASVFADYLNNTMLLNFGDQTELGPYKDSIDLPQYTKDEAKVFLNKKVNLDKSLQINVENVEIKKQNETNGEN